MLLLGCSAVLAMPRAGRAEPAPDRTASRRGAAARALADTVTIEGDGSYGAGVLVVPAQGLIVTAGHVVAAMSHPRVTFVDGTSFTAKVLESDAVLDVALIEVPPQPARPAPLLGDTTALVPGDEVLAVGCPRHLPFSVARGIVSYVGRQMDGARWLQTDIPINDGNSGGPVVDGDGRVVAITSFILRRAQGLSFSLPIGYAVARFSRLRALATAEDRAAFAAWSEGRVPIGGVATNSPH